MARIATAPAGGEVGRRGGGAWCVGWWDGGMEGQVRGVFVVVAVVMVVVVGRGLGVL